MISSKKELFSTIVEKTEIVFSTEGFNVNTFDCCIEEYNDFLRQDLPLFLASKMCKIYLLVSKCNNDIIAYMTLNTDTISLEKDEKATFPVLCDIPINNIPSIKIGKLAVSKKYKNEKLPYGSFMLFVAIGAAENVNDDFAGCRFLLVDADIENNKTVESFYIKNGFVRNLTHKSRTKAISMRLDLLK
jgi:hypothetical protein